MTHGAIEFGWRVLTVRWQGRSTLLFFVLLAALTARAAVVAPAWPFGEGQAVRSTHYAVYMTVGDAAEVELDVVMSEAIPEGDWREVELAGRTFSFVKVSHDGAGPPPRFRVVKLGGDAATAVEIQPRRLGLRPALQNGREVRDLSIATAPGPAAVSVNFVAPDNTTSPNRWIRHMLMIFVDPGETDAPGAAGPGVVAYERTSAPGAIAAAGTLHFAAGYHNLRDYVGGAGGPIEDGILTLGSGQRVYLAPGAFVHGLIDTANFQGDTGQRVFGRGILSGRLHPWYNKPGYTGPRYQQIVRLGQSARLDGVMVMESPSHGIVTGNRAGLSDFQYLGWHSNNDGVRSNPNSTVTRAFIRAVDDHFYNFALTVTNSVLWAGHNGAILTYGWGGTAGDNTYNAGASRLSNLDIIHPEWINRGNNNGLVAAQTGLDFAPHNYGSGTLTRLSDIRVDGAIPCLINLKPRSAAAGDIVAVPVAANDVGYLGDLEFDDLRIDGFTGRGRIAGATAAATTGSATYLAKNVNFRNVMVGETVVTDANVAQFIDIDAATTTALSFTATVPEAPGFISASNFSEPGTAVVFWGESPAARTGYDLQRRDLLGAGLWTHLPVDGAFDHVLVESSIGPVHRASLWRYRVRTRRGEAVSVWREGQSEVAMPPLVGEPSRLSNISCRLQVDDGQTVIPGFVLGGTGKARVLVRAVGPTLGGFGVGAVMPDPEMTLFENGQVVAGADDWSGAAVVEAAVQTGAFALAAGSADAALVAEVYPGRNYTVHVKGKPTAAAAGGGIALVEVYLLPEETPTCRLANASILAPTRPGERVLTLGFVLAGANQATLSIRGAGPALLPFGVTGALADPRMAVFSGGMAVLEGDDWAAEDGLAPAFAALGAFAFGPGSADAGLAAALGPGGYTVQVSGESGESGTTLVELYTME